jgi:hypothetical protein
MKILAVRDIVDGMVMGGERLIDGGGWAPASLSSHTEKLRDTPMRNKYQSDFKLQWVSSVQYHAGEGEWAAERAAHAIHHELYGEIISRLDLLAYKMECSDKEGCVEVLHSLIEDLTGRVV